MRQRRWSFCRRRAGRLSRRQRGLRWLRWTRVGVCVLACVRLCVCVCVCDRVCVWGGGGGGGGGCVDACCFTGLPYMLHLLPSTARCRGCVLPFCRAVPFLLSFQPA